MLAFELLSGWLLADFISGIAHWAEDRLLLTPARWGFLEGIRQDNIKHHKRPGAVTLLSMVENINTTVPVVWPIAALLWFAGVPLVIWSAFVFVGFGNYVHRLSHENPESLGWTVTILQWTGLFIPYEDHHPHHFDRGGRVIAKENAKDNYCVMTSWLNPLLDKIQFWRFMEWMFL